MVYVLQTGEYRRQYGTDPREIRDELGRPGAAQNSGTDGGEEEDGLSSIQDVAQVSKGSLLFCLTMQRQLYVGALD